MPPVSSPAIVSAQLLSAFHAQKRGDLKTAERLYRAVLAVQPDQFDALHLLGTLLHSRKRTLEGLDLLSRALSVDPSMAEAWANRGLAMLEYGWPAEALLDLEKAESLSGPNAEWMVLRGWAHVALREFDVARGIFEQVLEVEPGHLRAIAHLEALKADSAIATQSPAVRKELTEILANRASLLLIMEHAEEAIAECDRALALDPLHAQARFNRSLALLTVGRLQEGWDGYEARWEATKQPDPGANKESPQWTGAQDIAGKRVLLFLEQGFGDTLHACRYVAMVEARGAQVLALVQKPLERLLLGLRGISQQVPESHSLPGFDFQCSLMSLPHAFGTSLETIPAAVPYIQPDPALVAARAREMEGLARPRIGIAWAGSPEHVRNDVRSIRLQAFKQALPPDVSIVLLQKDVPEQDQEELATLPNLWRPIAPVTDFADTAALIANLDLVLCVDTSVAHLAGAMGKPVWILLYKGPDWRWMLHRTDSPWYPTARLWRQQCAGEWGPLLAEIRGALARQDWAE